GAGLLIGTDAVSWHALPEKVLLPTLLAVGIAYGISFLLNVIKFRVPECVCVGVDAPAGAPAAVDATGVAAFSPPPGTPRMRVEVGTVTECRVHGSAASASISRSTACTGCRAEPRAPPAVSTTHRRSWRSA